MLSAKTGLPAASFPLALKTWVPPTSREKVLAGLSVTLCTPALPRLVLLLPRQPVRATTKAMANVSRTIPGVQQVAAVNAVPMDGGLPDGMFLAVTPQENPKDFKEYSALAKQTSRRGTVVHPRGRAGDAHCQPLPLGPVAPEELVLHTMAPV